MKNMNIKINKYTYNGQILYRFHNTYKRVDGRMDRTGNFGGLVLPAVLAVLVWLLLVVRFENVRKDASGSLGSHALL